MMSSGIGDLPGIDPSKAHAARMYDYYLGGENNFEADRMACVQLDNMMPGVRGLAINNRRYLVRLVRTLASEYGVRQFLDIGSGLPTENNVHQVAKQAHPDARVVYVDNDPIVAVHARALTHDDGSTAFVLEDFRNTDAILNHPDTQRLIDFTEPVALLLLSFLHFIPDRDHPEGIVRRLMSSLAPGSFLAISHGVTVDPELRAQATEIMNRTTEGHFGRGRTRAEVDKFFSGLEIIPPGLVEITTWRPDDTPPVEQTRDAIEYGGAGRKPSS
jgi:trans-aconitate methyltransferase